MTEEERKQILLQRSVDAIQFVLKNPTEQECQEFWTLTGLEPFDGDYRINQNRILRWAAANLSAALKIVG